METPKREEGKLRKRSFPFPFGTECCSRPRLQLVSQKSHEPFISSTLFGWSINGTMSYQIRDCPILGSSVSFPERTTVATEKVSERWETPAMIYQVGSTNPGRCAPYVTHPPPCGLILLLLPMPCTYRV